MFEGTKCVIRNRKSKDRQSNNTMANDLHNITQRTKDPDLNPRAPEEWPVPAPLE